MEAKRVPLALKPSSFDDYFIKKLEFHLNLIRTMNERRYSTITTSRVAVFTASKNALFSISFV